MYIADVAILYSDNTWQQTETVVPSGGEYKELLERGRMIILEDLTGDPFAGLMVGNLPECIVGVYPLRVRWESTSRPAEAGCC